MPGRNAGNAGTQTQAGSASPQAARASSPQAGNTSSQVGRASPQPGMNAGSAGAHTQAGSTPSREFSFIQAGNTFSQGAVLVPSQVGMQTM